MKKGPWAVLGRLAGVTYSLLLLFLIVFILVKSVVAWHESNSNDNTDAEANAPLELRDIPYFVNDSETEQGRIEKLPFEITGLAPQDKVTLRFTLMLNGPTTLLVRSEYSKLEIYTRLAAEDGSPIGDLPTVPYFSTDKTIPEFQIEPPVEMAVLQLPFDQGNPRVHLQMQYTVSDIDDTLRIPTMIVGDRDAIFSYLMDRGLVSLVIGVLMLIAGFALILVGLISIRRTSLESLFIWLGLTCLATAMWTVSVNEIVLTLIPMPSLLYNLASIGGFALLPPFMRFNMVIFANKRNWLIRVLYLISSAAFIIVLLVYVFGAGALPFAHSINILYNLSPAFLGLFLIAVIIEHVYFRNPQALRYIVSCFVFSTFVALELINVALEPSILPEGLFFQIGLAFFVFELAILAWEHIDSALQAADKTIILETEIASTNRALEAQRTLYQTLATSNEEIRKLRHDMRHQLSVLRGYADEQHVEEAKSYIDNLIGTIPSTAGLLLCDNFAVNALIAHYLAIAHDRNIQVELKMVVPEKVGRASDNDLCIIIGNLFENAIEACTYVEEHKRFIKILSAAEKNRFTLIMDNSYDGRLDVRNGEFYSRKRTGKGIGMASVKAEVRKYEGAMKYETADGVFKTSLYIKI
ncbi:MAG: GHKL domain-containing protein [Coriobacteriales bacterium]|nr:GHKL domain-containing protein [Coriobacteriales bacterium]